MKIWWHPFVGYELYYIHKNNGMLLQKILPIAGKVLVALRQLFDFFIWPKVN